MILNEFNMITKKLGILTFMKLTVIGLCDWRWYETRVAGLIVVAVVELDVGLLQVSHLSGSDGRRCAGWDPRLEAFEVCQLE